MEFAVGDKSIVELASSFLSLRIFDKMGEEWSSSMGVGIPLVSYITNVLVNFLLDDFDREFMRSFPDLSYVRFLYIRGFSKAFFFTGCKATSEALTLTQFLHLELKLALKE
ncbi:hypothetical protein Ancab_037830 [Ancistrocladus abbreviatus]